MTSDTATSPPRFSRRFLASFATMIVGGTIALAVVVTALALYLRSELRSQILSRDVELLEAFVALEYELLDAEDLLRPVEYRHLAMNVGALRGVLAMAVFDREGVPLDQVPSSTNAVPLSEKETTRANEGGYGQLHPALDLAVIFNDASPRETVTPVVEIVVPLHTPEQETPALIRFWIDGTPMTAEFAALDRQLLWQGGLAWLGASLLLGAIGGIGALRLRSAARELEDRQLELERTNRELETAARSGAVGAVTSHLVHGLRNPLAGLLAYLRAHGDEDSREAAARMQALVSETLAVFRNARDDGKAKCSARQSLSEAFEIFSDRLRPIAVGQNLQWREECAAEGTLEGREFNLLLLVLENLVHNAVEASSPGTTVTLGVESDPERIVWYVADEGSGVPPAQQKDLFTPGHSGKTRGTGLGLAISRQLAKAIGGDLRLAATGTSGTRFEISFPVEISTPSTTPSPS